MSYQKLTLNVTNKTLLEKFLSKFPLSINKGKELFLKMTPTKFVATDYEIKTKSVIKRANLEYKDFMEEAELPFEGEIYIPLNGRYFLDYLSAISGDKVTMEITFDEVTDKHIISEIKSVTKKDYDSVSVANNITLKTKKTKLKVKTKDIVLFIPYFYLTEEIYEKVTVSTEENTLFKFQVTKNDLATLTKMIALGKSYSKNRTSLSFEVEKNSVVAKTEDFTLVFPLLENSERSNGVSANISIDKFDDIDKEDFEFVVMESENSARRVLCKSTESDTVIMFATNTKS